ncbi:hypothetical protein BC830DRAFT_1162987 [Chytriomyces sp. MP71]|nr:hypothetical protein BC830DRAFT_1162987 [Chytriomyces sp. MP71]
MASQTDFYNRCAANGSLKLEGEGPSAMALLSAVASAAASPMPPSPGYPSQLKGAGGIDLLGTEHEDNTTHTPYSYSASPTSPTSPTTFLSNSFVRGYQYEAPVFPSMQLVNSFQEAHIRKEAYRKSPVMATPPVVLAALRGGDKGEKSRPGPVTHYSKKGSYECEYPGCTRAFKKPCLLKSHALTHSGEKPYICGQCDQAFIRNHDLKRHERSVHSVGESAGANCRYCGKSFTRKDSCAFHEATSCKAVQRA